MSLYYKNNDKNDSELPFFAKSISINGIDCYVPDIFILFLYNSENIDRNAIITENMTIYTNKITFYAIQHILRDRKYLYVPYPIYNMYEQEPKRIICGCQQVYRRVFINNHPKTRRSLVVWTYPSSLQHIIRSYNKKLQDLAVFLISPVSIHKDALLLINEYGDRDLVLYISSKIAYYTSTIDKIYFLRVNRHKNNCYDLYISSYDPIAKKLLKVADMSVNIDDTSIPIGTYLEFRFSTIIDTTNNGVYIYIYCKEIQQYYVYDICEEIWEIIDTSYSIYHILQSGSNILFVTSDSVGVHDMGRNCIFLIKVPREISYVSHSIHPSKVVCNDKYILYIEDSTIFSYDIKLKKWIEKHHNNIIEIGYDKTGFLTDVEDSFYVNIGYKIYVIDPSNLVLTENNLDPFIKHPIVVYIS